MKKHALSILLLSCVTLPVQAGLFSDQEARNKIQQIGVQVEEHTSRLQSLEEAVKSQEEIDKQTIKANIDFQMQLDAIKSELQNLRGHNEELAHKLNDVEKRQKDFYVDLDTRLRFLEENKQKESQRVEPVEANDPIAENRAFEEGYVLFKNAKYAEAVAKFNAFFTTFSNSVHAPNVYYWLGEAQFALKDYKAAQKTYTKMLKEHPDSPKEAEALFNLAGSQGQEGDTKEAKKTLQQLLKKYPNHALAAKAKSLLDSL